MVYNAVAHTALASQPGRMARRPQPAAYHQALPSEDQNRGLKISLNINRAAGALYPSGIIEQVRIQRSFSNRVENCGLSGAQSGVQDCASNVPSIAPILTKYQYA